MTLQQIMAFAVIAGTMGLFVWGRLRYDLVAGLALLVAVLIGVVPADKAFSGFSDEIVVIVAGALIVSAAVARSGIIEVALQPLAPHVTSPRAQIIVLVGAVALLSAFVKNIGALAMMIPIALQMAKRSHGSPSSLLMPMAFGSLLGEPFGMFDFTPVGLGLSAAGALFLVLGYRLLPQDRHAAPALGEAIDIKDYVTEARVREDSEIAGQTVSELRKHANQEVMVTAVVRDEQTAAPLPDMVLQANDIVLLQGEPAALERAVAGSDLELEGENRTSRTDVIAAALSGVAHALPGYGAVALMLLAAMIITPFLNNAATVLVMAPIAASFAQKLGLQPDAFLMAVAIGAACDFLTPIGHQCNTLVMGPGGYRFGDYARLGAPLSLLILLLGVPLIMIVWPLS